MEQATTVEGTLPLFATTAMIVTYPMHATPTAARGTTQGRRRGGTAAVVTLPAQLVPGASSEGQRGQLRIAVALRALTPLRLQRWGYRRGPHAIEYVTISIKLYTAIDYMAAPPAYVIIAAETA